MIPGHLARPLRHSHDLCRKPSAAAWRRYLSGVQPIGERAQRCGTVLLKVSDHGRKVARTLRRCLAGTRSCGECAFAARFGPCSDKGAAVGAPVGTDVGGSGHLVGAN